MVRGGGGGRERGGGGKGGKGGREGVRRGNGTSVTQKHESCLPPFPPLSSGTVSLWSPNVVSPLVKMLCHRGPLTDLAVERGGWAMVTVGMDARMKIWDIRSTYRWVCTSISVMLVVCIEGRCVGVEYTVEPLNKGHIHWDHVYCPL